MSPRRILLHTALWLGVYGFWLFMTRDHHPTLAIAMLATGIMIAGSAAAVYINALVLLPRFAARRSWIGYLLWLGITVAAITFPVVISIQWIYDALWGPDPLRYGFWTNVGYDVAGIVVHLLLAMGITGLMRRRSRAGDRSPR